MSQDEDKVTIMSQIACECIDNIPDSVWKSNPKKEVEDCFKASTLGGLLSMIPSESTKKTDSIVLEVGNNKVKNGDTVIDSIDENDLELTKQKLRKNCNRYKDFETRNLKNVVKDNSEKIVDVAYDACECIGKISTNLTAQEKSEAIKSCITSANMAWQLKKSMTKMTEKVKDTLDKTHDISKIDSLTIPSDNKDIIVTDSDYEEIESYLFDTCGDMEAIYFADNLVKENSYSNQEKAIEYYEKGINAFQNQNYKKAISLYKKAVKEDKKFAFAWDNLGRTYRELGNYKEAIKCYKKSLKIDPKGSMPLMNIALTYGFLKDYDKAKKAYRQYGKVFENDPETYFGLGRIYTIEGDFENGLDNMMQAYVLYIKMNSPYKLDAEKLIVVIAKELKKKNQLDVVKRLSKKYNIQLIED